VFLCFNTCEQIKQKASFLKQGQPSGCRLLDMQTCKLSILWFCCGIVELHGAGTYKDLTCQVLLSSTSVCSQPPVPFRVLSLG
jgi:hypothetical protein